MKPIKGMQRSNCWKPKGKVWYQHNEDFEKIKQEQIQADKNITAITKSDFKNQKTSKTRRY
jgi:hypothetical protein